MPGVSKSGYVGRWNALIVAAVGLASVSPVLGSAQPTVVALDSNEFVVSTADTVFGGDACERNGTPGLLSCDEWVYAPEGATENNVLKPAPSGARDAVLSPDGSTLYVTGFTRGATNDVLIAALDTATGLPRWRTSYDAGPSSQDSGGLIRVSPDGAHVFVQANIPGPHPFPDFGFDGITLAFDAATGAQEWTRTFTVGNDLFSMLSPSPDGRHVVIAGWTYNWTGPTGNVLAASYDAATGTPAWTFEFGFGPKTYESFWDARIDPQTNTLVILGTAGAFTRFVTGLDLDTGQQRWTRILDEPGSPFWTRLVDDPVTGGFRLFGYLGYFRNSVFQTGTLNPADGSTGPHVAFDLPPTDIYSRFLLSPEGTHAYLTGTNFNPFTLEVTGYSAAVDVGTGDVLYRIVDAQGIHTSALSGDGATLYQSRFDVRPVETLVEQSPPPYETDLLTSAMDSSTGALKWTARLDAGPKETAAALLVSSDGGHLYSAGYSWTGGQDGSVVAAAYDAEDPRPRLEGDPGLEAQCMAKTNGRTMINCSADTEETDEVHVIQKLQGHRRGSTPEAFKYERAPSSNRWTSAPSCARSGSARCSASTSRTPE